MYRIKGKDMVFSSPIFLFGFLPIALLLYYFSPRLIKNTTLLLLSLLFYAWGEVFYLGVMIVSILSNYFVGLLIYNSQKESHGKKLSQLYVIGGVIVNIALLTSFKYANFIADNINIVFSLVGINSITLEPVHLPLGISFFTFQAISYIVDVYRKEVPSQKNIFNLALYISLFPQLIAGPIVRYHDVSLQITSRSHSIELFASGVQRFIYGLAKKMLIANPLAEVADSIFALSGNDLTMPLAWIGILAYTLQIYFDFSGYSDMAIGLGRMFGFRFHENFNYPYISTSLREFWRRWHISLSTWFRDYVYIPLGGNRVSTIRVYTNLLIIFILTGFWHGASWNFLIWGLFHGVFLASEHAGLSNILQKIWKPIQHFYLLTVVIVSWVFFRAETLSQAINYIHAMIDISNYQTTYYQFVQVLSYETIYIFLIGTILSVPVYPLIRKYLARVSNQKAIKIAYLIDIPRLLILSSLLFLSILKLASSTYNPFIYFRF
jgi:alginate O-acetyltransferase complex protein AlgI